MRRFQKSPHYLYRLRGSYHLKRTLPSQIAKKYGVLTVSPMLTYHERGPLDSPRNRAHPSVFVSANTHLCAATGVTKYQLQRQGRLFRRGTSKDLQKSQVQQKTSVSRNPDSPFCGQVLPR